MFIAPFSPTYIFIYNLNNIINLSLNNVNNSIIALKALIFKKNKEAFYKLLLIMFNYKLLLFTVS